MTPMPKLQELFDDSLENLTLPDVYIRLRELMESETASMADAAEILSSDPALAARILRMANSPYYGLRARVDTITRAANILGMQQLHDLALAAGVARIAEGLQNPVMDLNTFWYRSLHSAFLAREMASQAGLRNGESLFVLGLLHDIGRLLLFAHFPEACREALSQSGENLEQRLSAERQLIGIDAYRLTADLVDHWGLPEHFSNAFAHLVRPGQAPEPAARDTAILRIAIEVSDGIDFDLLVEEIMEQILPETWQQAGLTTETAMAALQASSLEMVDAMYRTLSPHAEAA